MFRFLSFTILLSNLAFSSTAQTNKDKLMEKGVSLELAEYRAANLTQISYHLYFNIPEKKSVAIEGRLQLSFDFIDKATDLILDFNNEADKIHEVTVLGKEVPWKFENGHIVIPNSVLRRQKNIIQISFEAGNQALNRNDEYLYTLFVPDRAATAFPCFDQPDLKGRFVLELIMPETWLAVANGNMLEKRLVANKHHYIFNETAPISTYLFGFVAGKFSAINSYRDGRQMTMYHRETDTAKITANKDAIFDLHASALTWLEKYTDIPMPFEKFDFVLIPSFQFGGMEHVGAILYRSASLMLDPSATQNQQLGRASLIAHETAHMWFGDLVTMKWFNDVWLKEVFANFMAAKIVNPSFPDIDHDLRFLLAHHPAAYSEDRTGGSHPIQQKLENLKDAGTLYGRIIYQKAPVVMKQLEQIVGEEELRIGLQEYLNKYAFDNATWDELINILEKKTTTDLADWSAAWVKEKGMPHYQVVKKVADGKITSLRVIAKNKTVSDKFWQQEVKLTLVYGKEIKTFPLMINGEVSTLQELNGYKNPDFVLIHGNAYGYFELDNYSEEYLINNISEIKDNTLRGRAWVTLYEAMLRRSITSETFIQVLINALPKENEALNTQNILGYLVEVYWRFLNAKKRLAIAENIENLLWQLMESAPGQAAKSAYFKSYLKVAQTEEAITRLKLIWDGDLQISDMVLSENDFTQMTCEIAIKKPEWAVDILNKQLEKITNSDRKARFAFVSQALSPKQAERNAFFNTLKTPANRTHEPWVLQALHYLHHPLRAKEVEKYIEESLLLLEEIQQTGSIFFPKRWLLATFNGHSSKTATTLIEKFLRERPEYPYRLKNKILQAADPLFRVR